MSGSQEVIKALTEKYDVYIASAAMEFKNSLEDKLEWLNEHFPFISWTNIIFCGHKILDADIIIDDRIKNFVTFKGRKLLFTSPHNMLITDFERVNTWDEVAAKLLH
jgi:5'(3')-deoxyribonucleotidase